MNFLRSISIVLIISCLTVQPSTSFHTVMEKLLYLHRLKQCWIFPMGKNCMENNVIDDAIAPQTALKPVQTNPQVIEEGLSSPSTSSPTSHNSVLSTTVPTNAVIELSYTPAPNLTLESTGTVTHSEVNPGIVTTTSPATPTSTQSPGPKCPSGNTTITLQNLYNVPRYSQKVEVSSATEDDIVNRNLHRLCNMEGFKCETNEDCGKNRKCCKVKFRKQSISSFVGPFFGACKICLFL